MLSLTGQPLLLCTAALATIAPVVAVVLWTRHRRIHRSRTSVLGRDGRAVLGRAALVVVAQLLAVTTAFLVLNTQYGFYTSWADLFGRSTQAAPVQNNDAATSVAASIPALSRADGTISPLTVPGSVIRVTHQTLVWLPPEYRQPRYANTRFPVVMFLPGQPSSPSVVFQHYDFGSIASRAMARGQVHPFVAVFPPLMTNPPRDTECTDIPGGPQAESWLTSAVPAVLASHYRVAAPGRQWSVMGWSTGGFCAAKLVLAHPNLFGAAVSFGGYFQPLTDQTTGDLFHRSRTLQRENSPLALYRRYGLRGGRLLIIAGRQDRGSWNTSAPMITATRGDKNVSYIAFPTGGHNYRNYRAYLQPALLWLDHSP